MRGKNRDIESDAICSAKNKECATKQLVENVLVFKAIYIALPTVGADNQEQGKMCIKAMPASCITVGE
jgi:hypothetical protein